MFSPESPRYLVEVGRMEDARAVLRRLYGSEYADQAIREIQEAVELEESVAVRKWSDIFQNNKQCFRYRTVSLSVLPWTCTCSQSAETPLLRCVPSASTSSNR